MEMNLHEEAAVEKVILARPEVQISVLADFELVLVGGGVGDILLG